MKKVCTKCSIEKVVTEFYKNKQIKCGYDYWCKKCQLKKRRKYSYKKSPKTIEREKLLLENKKRCTQCDNIKEVAEFNKYNKSKSGYSSWCKKCKKEKYYNYSSSRQYNYQKCDKTLEREKLLQDNKKRCTKCDDIKSLDHFSKNKQVKFGYNSSCKKCHRDKRIENYKIDHQIKKQINPEYYLLKEERKQLLQIGKYKCYTCDGIKEVSQFSKTGKYYSNCKQCENKYTHERLVLKNLAKDPDYYIKKEKKKRDKVKKLKKKDLLLAEGKKECRKCKKVLLIESFETIEKHNCISCYKEQKRKESKRNYEKEKEKRQNDPEFIKRKIERERIRAGRSEKECIKCKIIKKNVKEHFPPDTNCADGLRNVCRECENTRDRERWELNTERRERKKKYMRERIKYRRLCAKIERIFNRIGNVKEWEILDKNKYLYWGVKRSLYYKNIVSSRISPRKAGRFIRVKLTPEQKEISRINKNRRAYERRKQRKKEDPIYKAKLGLRRSIRKSITNRGWTKTSSTQEILGISWDEFRLHMERQFKEGMSWENRSDWHIDHIIPLATAQCVEDIYKLNHYTNLQPLWPEENLAKGSKIL